MDARVPALPFFIIGAILLVYDTLLGLIVLLIGLVAYLSTLDPSHAYVSMYFLVPLIVFLLFVWASWESVPYERRPIIIIAFVLISLAIAATLGHDYSGVLFAPMFIIPIGLALLVDPKGYLAVFAAVATYVPYSLLIMYIIRSVKDVKEHPMIGKEGVVVKEVTKEGGVVKIGNTYRDAVTYLNLPIKPGTKVIVVGVKDLMLIVEPRSLSVSRRFLGLSR